MKNWIIIVWIICYTTYSVVAQSCKKINIDDNNQKRILTEFINDAVRKGAFVGDKGIVVVNRFINENGRPSWLIRSTIDDSYKDNPPLEWTSLDGDIVLFYDTQSSMHDVSKHKPTNELLSCLDEIIGDRLYIRPNKRQRLLDSGFTTSSGKPIIVDVHRLPITNSIIIVFEADGSITKLRPV